MGRVRNFRFGSILSTFFFEWVLGLSPRVEIAPHGVWDLAQHHWANVMCRLGGSRVANPYPVEFFPWWWRQIVTIEDFPTDFFPWWWRQVVAIEDYPLCTPQQYKVSSTMR